MMKLRMEKNNSRIIFQMKKEIDAKYRMKNGKYNKWILEIESFFILKENVYDSCFSLNMAF